MHRVLAEEWTPDRVGAFWDYFSTQHHRRSEYFSLQFGEGVVNLLKLYGGVHGDVLDYGCGPGYLCRNLLQAGANVWGCDWSSMSVRYANELLAGFSNWRGADETGNLQADYRNRKYDLVTCVETIEHVGANDEQPFFAALLNLLNHDGLLFLTTPNNENLQLSETYCPFCDRSFHSMQHVRSFSESTLAEVLRRNGFTPNEIGIIDFADLQQHSPALPDMSLRSVARAVRAAAFSFYDKVTGQRIPSFSKSRWRRSARLPHLFALARPAHI